MTFVFTDIEGSTRMWEQHPVEMGPSLERHDEILRNGVESRGGRVFSLAGDGFGAVFNDPEDAISSSIEIQRQLDAEPWPEQIRIRVRIGIHTGTAEERAGDFFGTVVNRTARLMSAGHGGQVLLSTAVRERAPDHHTTDLGLHRLKDLSAAEHIWQLEIDGLQSEFRPLRTLDPHTTNLPVRRSALFGRESEQSQIASLLGDHRVVTLGGPGGVGKTSLILQVAADVAHDFEEGVWLIELAPVADPEVLPFQFLDSMGMAAETASSPTDAVVKAIGSKRVLLVVDNCEHLRAETEAFLSEILAACPNIVVLASSREPLGITGEVLKRVEPLSTEGGESPAVTLFVERAHEADPELEITDDDRLAIAELCRQLDGLPLAIELAAARSKSMTLAELASRIDQRFRVLRKRTSGDDRHATLRDTIAWSHQMLDTEERVLFERLSVFAGSFTLQAVESVCTDDIIDELDVFDLLDRLVERSMVVADVSGPKGRYSLLRSLKDFGVEELADELVVWRKRHAAEYARWMQEVIPLLRTSQELEALNDLDEGWEDLRVAVHYARDAQDRGLFELLVDGLALEVLYRSRAEVAEWAEWAAVLPGSPSAGMVAVQTSAASITGRQEDVWILAEQFRAMDQADPACARPFDALVVGLAVHLAGQPDLALAHYNTAIEKAPGEEGRVVRAWAAVQRALLFTYTGKPDEAAVEVLEARALADAGGMSLMMQAGLELVDTLRMIEPPARVIERSVKTSEIAKRLRSELIRNVSQMIIAAARDELGEVGKAHADAAQILAEHRRSNYLVALSQQLRRSAVMLMNVGQFEDALLVLAYLDMQRAPEPNPATGKAIDELRPKAMEAVGEDSYASIESLATKLEKTAIVDLTVAALRSSIPDEGDESITEA